MLCATRAAVDDRGVEADGVPLRHALSHRGQEAQSQLPFVIESQSPVLELQVTVLCCAMLSTIWQGGP